MINDMEFFRYLIDLIDSKIKAASTTTTLAPTVVINIDNKESVSSEEEHEEVETAMDKDNVFIPPLQAKIEMMKKMTGMEPKNQELLSSEDDEPFDG